MLRTRCPCRTCWNRLRRRWNYRYRHSDLNCFRGYLLGVKDKFKEVIVMFGGTGVGAGIAIVVVIILLLIALGIVF